MTLQTVDRRRALVATLIAMGLGLTGSACGSEEGSVDEDKVADTNLAPVRRPIPCLAWSGVDEKSSELYVTGIEQFKRQLDLIKKRGFTAVSFSDFSDPGKPLPEKAVLLFADTSNRSFYKHALPALEKRELSVDIAVQCGDLGKPWIMTDAQLGDAVARGHRIASGGHSQVNLTALSDIELADQLDKCRKELLKKGWTVDTVAYPFGAWDGRVIKAAQAAGFKAGRATGAKDISGGGYASRNASRRFRVGCALPVTTTTDEQFEAYLDNDKIELEDVYEVKEDAGLLGKIDRGDFGGDHFGHVFMADQGDTVTIPLVFSRKGSFDIKLRVKTGTKIQPKSTVDDYAYKFDGLHVTPKADGTPEPDKDSDHVAWGWHTLPGVAAEAGVHELEIKCLNDWSCLLDWVHVTEVKP